MELYGNRIPLRFEILNAFARGQYTFKLRPSVKKRMGRMLKICELFIIRIYNRIVKIVKYLLIIIFGVKCF